MEQKDYRLAAIMYTDIVGFSRMMEKDEAGTLDLLRLHNTLVTDIARKRHGTVIKTIGDAFLIDFRNTVEALQCAMEVQDALYAHNKSSGQAPLLMRIGVHLGDIYFFENDALGEGINIASRLQSLAKPGCICFSQDVYNQVLNKIDFRAEKLGKVSLKNITKEIHAYEIASPNVEFDPDHDKPRPGYKPDVPAEAPATSPITIPVGAPTAAPAGQKPLPGMPAPSERSYSPEGARTIMEDIRKAILEDTRTAGRRLTVQEAVQRYGEYGVEAREVIATLADRGLLVKKTAIPTPPAAPTPPTDLAKDIGSAVEDIVRAIGTHVNTWQESGRQGRRPPGPHAADLEGRLEEKLERIADRIDRKTSHAVDRAERGANNAFQFGFTIGDRADEKRAIKASLTRHSEEVATGKWDAELKDSDYFKPGTEELETDFSRYRDKVEDRSRKLAAGFVGNVLSFVGVNALLWYINLNWAPGFLWAAIVTAGWGTGLVSNVFAMLRGKAKTAELEKMPDLERDALEQYKRLNKVRDSMAMHLASVLSVPALLFVINLLTSPGFLWAVIPSGIMALSFIGHLVSYPGTKRGIEKKLFRLLGIDSWRELFGRGGARRAAAAGAGPYAQVYAEAASARDDIVRAIKAGKASRDLGKDMIPTLDRYVDQVKLLTHSVNEIDAIVGSIPTADLAKDRADLESKLAATASVPLKDEYRRSIAEIDRQEKASKELEDQREVLRLRLSSSVNALKQLKLDMARMKALPEAGEHQAIEEIRRKAEEMAGYLDDLKVGYAETEKDPYAELERLAAEADARKRITGAAAPGATAPGATAPEPTASTTTVPAAAASGTTAPEQPAVPDAKPPTADASAGEPGTGASRS